MPLPEPWSSAFVLVLCLSLSGCGTGVQLIREGEMGGVVRYLYKENEGHLLSSHRGEAFRQIKKFCVGPYDVVQEGPTNGRSRVVEGVGGAEIITEQWWGIRFRCKV